ncbi:ABC transporter substrate-binding protein [Synergistaceae bacterium OttesenSCG-928-D05]|nr:ABC transporter substrate-binding protein [Synergistaceae bacterium OttesenSCG-928-D05]
MEDRVKQVLKELIEEYGIAILEDSDRLSQFLENRCAGERSDNFRLTFALRYLLKAGWTPQVKISDRNDAYYADMLIKNLGYTASAAKDVVGTLRDITSEPEPQNTEDEEKIVASPGNLRRIAGGISNKPRTMWLRKKSMRNGLVLVAALLAIIVLFFQIGRERSPVGDEFRIAFLAKMTGPNSQHSLNQLRAAQLAVEAINKQDGVRGYKLKIVGFDVPVGPEAAKTALDRIISDQNILALLSTVGGETGEALLAKADEQNVPIIITAPELTGLREDGKPYLYTFRIVNDADDRSKMLAYFATQGLMKKKAAFFYDSESVFARKDRDNAIAWVRQYGGEVVADIGYLKRFAADHRAAMEAIKQSGADVLILPGGDIASAQIVADARAAGFTNAILGEDYTAVLPSIAGKSMAGTWWINEVSAQDPQIRSVLKDYRTLYNENCPEEDVKRAILAYDAVRWIAGALYNAPGYRGEAIRHALLSTLNFPMTHATLTLDPRTHGPYNKAMAVIYCDTERGIFQKRVRTEKPE